MSCDALFKYVFVFPHVVTIAHPKKRMRPHNWGALLCYAQEVELKLHVHPQVTHLRTGERLGVL